jgi:hypothetical protein
LGFEGAPNQSSPATQDAAAYKDYELYGYESQWGTDGCGGLSNV